MPASHPPNRLLQGLIIFSVVVHGVMAWRMADHYHSTQLTYLELTLAENYKPSMRHIPRPRFAPAPPKPLKSIEPNTIEPWPHRPPPPAEALSAPSVNIDAAAPPQVPRAVIADWAPPGTHNPSAARSYLEMVRNLIEHQKQYPERFKRHGIQGRVEVAFTIASGGQVEQLAVTRGAASEALNVAALDAVRKAAPFPPPPLELFGGAPKVTLTIVFELV
jgi:periplasmic protein TonB